MALKRWAYLFTGWVFTVLAFIGVLLPLVPTTPFLIGAAFCFSRSSDKWHERILNSPIFGKYLRRWNEEHTVPHNAKIRALIMTGVSFGASTFFVGSLVAKGVILGLGAFVAWRIWRLPERPAGD